MCFIKVSVIVVLHCVILTTMITDAAIEPPTVKIPNQGEVVGVFMKMYRTRTILAYLGLPYAHPPVAEKRFQPPFVDNLPSWEGVRNITELPAECWSETRKAIKQHDEAFLKLIGIDPKNKDKSRYSEDCLFLNVYMPVGDPPIDGYAVMVWLHSGDFNRGNVSAMSPFQLVFKHRVMVVTVAYRLGLLGFFTTGDGESPGNYGLMDQSAALVWINRNIKLFKGNPQAVTLMGHGAGAVSTSLHLTSGEWSRDLFQRAIIMSGTSVSSTAVRLPSSYKTSLDLMASNFGCNRMPTSDLVACLRRVPTEYLYERGPDLFWGPIIDEGLSNFTTAFIQDDPRLLIARPGVLNHVSLMIGYTDTEDSLDISMGDVLEDGITRELYETLTGDVVLNELWQSPDLNNDTTCGNNQVILDALNFVYRPYPPISEPSVLRKKFIEFSTDRSFAAPIFQMALEMSKSSEVYVYRFDMRPKTAEATDHLPAWAGVPQSFDQVFIWGLPYFIELENQTQWDTIDKRLSDIIMTMWTNFIKFGNPTENGVYIHWANFTENQQGVLIIDRAFNMSDSITLNYQAIQFWNSYYPKVVDFAIHCCNASSAVPSSINFFRSSYNARHQNFFIRTILFYCCNIEGLLLLFLFAINVLYSTTANVNSST